MMVESSTVLRITRSGRCVVVGFCSREFAAGSECFDGRHDEVVRLIESHECNRVIFDLTGVAAVDENLLELVASAGNQRCEIELLNPSQAVLSTLRDLSLDARLLVRGTTA